MGSLHIKDIKKSYGDHHILQGINIQIEQGEFLILVGPSGCGKSTLLSMIAGLEQANSGEIWIGNRNITQLSPKERDIAMVFQSYALYPTMSVKDNIAFGLEIRKVPKKEREETIQKVARMLQIENLLSRKPGQLSGGQRQRVAMGRALARNPSLFLFDEPLSNLDAKLRVDMRSEIKLLQKRTGITTVYVTHDQIEAMTLGDKIAVMKEGILQQFGTPQEIYDAPSNLFVAGFMGSPSMNFINCKVLGNKDNPVLALTVADKTHLIPIPHAGLAERIGQEVILGVRPEMLTDTLSPAILPNKPELDIPVNLIEPTGADTLVFTQINGSKVVCRVHPKSIQQQSQMRIRMDMSKVVIFDPKTELRIV